MGLSDFRGYAFNSMRFENVSRMGFKFTEEISAVEAGMERFMSQKSFIGSENIKQRIKKGIKIKLVFLVFDDEIAAGSMPRLYIMKINSLVYNWRCYGHGKQS